MVTTILAVYIVISVWPGLLLFHRSINGADWLLVCFGFYFGIGSLVFSFLFLKTVPWLLGNY